MQSETNNNFGISTPRGIRPPVLSPTAVPRSTSGARDESQGLVTIEAVQLLEDVRVPLDCDTGAADDVATRLLDVLRVRELEERSTSHASIKLPRWKMRRLKQYIEDHLEEPILISDLARCAFLSTSYFCRVFKADTGESPHAFVMRVKIDRAQTLMLRTTLAMSQIALACGLADQSHLCRCFRQLTGTTPAAWRRASIRAMQPIAAPARMTGKLPS